MATSDPGGLLASPLTTVPRGRGDLDRLAGLAIGHEAIEVIVGLPTGLSGRPVPVEQSGDRPRLARTFLTQWAEPFTASEVSGQ